MSELVTVRCPKFQCAIWNDQFTKEQSQTYRFKCNRCGNVVKVSGCGVCKTNTMELIHGVVEDGPHRPYFRFRCLKCGREVRFQNDVWST